MASKPKNEKKQKKSERAIAEEEVEDLANKLDAIHRTTVLEEELENHCSIIYGALPPETKK